MTVFAPDRSAPTSAGTVVIWHRFEGAEQGRDSISMTLQQHHYRVMCAQHKNDVLRKVIANVPDLLLIHLQASGEAGYKLCKTLRKLSRTSTVPVVFLGTRSEASETVRALRCGGNEYIQLPIDQEECQLRLDRHLQAAQLVRSLKADKDSLHQQIWSYNNILREHEEREVSLAEENQMLQRMAFVDGLTQVANRRRFNQQIPQLWQQSYHSGQPMSLLLCDIDYFKRYNDHYGHLGGDGCLQAVASAMVRGAHRHSDQVARYGGEEFAILLPATDLKGAQQVALSVQSEIAKAQIPHQASLVKDHVSLSIGLCTLLPETLQQSYEVLIHGADEAMYTAKLRGRDRVVINGPDGLISIVQNQCLVPDNSAGDAAVARKIPAKMVLNTPPLPAAAFSSAPSPLVSSSSPPPPCLSPVEETRSVG
ncbi:MAG: diguanylate cyclase [Cyanobacteria bacterium J06597_16]